MKWTNVLSVSTLALAIMVAAGNTFGAASEPAYNPATVVHVLGTITGVRQIPAGAPLAGVHLTVNSKTGVFDVYLGPADFLKFLKAGFTVNEQIEVIGSKVKLENKDVILTQQVDDGYQTVTLRDAKGAEEWLNWGQEIDPALVQ